MIVCSTVKLVPHAHVVGVPATHIGVQVHPHLCISSTGSTVSQFDAPFYWDKIMACWRLGGRFDLRRSAEVIIINYVFFLTSNLEVNKAAV